MNNITVIDNFNWGDVAFDPSPPIDEASARINPTGLAFTRAFGLGGRAANAGVVVPVIGGHVAGLYPSEPAEITRFASAAQRGYRTNLIVHSRPLALSFSRLTAVAHDASCSRRAETPRSPPGRALSVHSQGDQP